jgi:hypothetical protein
LVEIAMTKLADNDILKSAALLQALNANAEALDDAEMSIDALREDLLDALAERTKAATLYNMSCSVWKDHLSGLAEKVNSQPWQDCIQDLEVPTVALEWTADLTEKPEFSEIVDVDQVTLQVTEPAA